MKCVHEIQFTNWSTSLLHSGVPPIMLRSSFSPPCEEGVKTSIVNRIDKWNQMEIYTDKLEKNKCLAPKIDGKIMCFVYVVIVLHVSYLMENLWVGICVSLWSEGGIVCKLHVSDSIKLSGE